MQPSARTTLARRCGSRLLVLVAAVALLGGLPAAAAVAQTHHKHAVKHRARHHRRAHAPARVAVRPASVQAASPVAAPTPPPSAPATCAGTDLVPTGANLAQVDAATLCLINNQRSAAGLPALRESPALDAAAAGHSADMVAHDYFDHVPPTGIGLVDQILAVGYATLGTLRDLGENLATGVDSLATPASTVATWMSSPGHRDNILDPRFTDTGIGVVASAPALLGTGGAGATYTQWFGRTA